MRYDDALQIPEFYTAVAREGETRELRSALESVPELSDFPEYKALYKRLHADCQKASTVKRKLIKDLDVHY